MRWQGRTKTLDDNNNQHHDNQRDNDGPASVFDPKHRQPGRAQPLYPDTRRARPHRVDAQAPRKQ
jgi:hypothetical protein